MCSISATCSTVYAFTGSPPSIVLVGGLAAPFLVVAECDRLRLCLRVVRAPLRADAGERRRRRQSLSVVDGGSPSTAGYLGDLTGTDEFLETLVNPGTAHAGLVHQLGHGDPVVRRDRQDCPQDGFRSVSRV